MEPASPDGLDEDQAGELRLRQGKRQRRKERKAARREESLSQWALDQASDPPEQVIPKAYSFPQEPLDLYNRFGVLGEAFKNQRSYADRVRLPSQPSQSSVVSSTLEDPLSPVPGLDVVLTPDRPSTSRRG